MTEQEIKRLKWRQAANTYNARKRAVRALSDTPAAVYMRGYRRGVRRPPVGRGPDGRFVRSLADG